jgi:hypothetical protein
MTAVTGEWSNSKLAAVFTEERAARAAAQAVTADLSLRPEQVSVITADEPHPGRKLEPEDRGIWRTVIKAHVRLGIAGAVAGLLVFAVLYLLGVQFVVASPVAAALVMLFFGAVAGLMLGGLISLRPDHDRYIDATREAVAAGDTTVLVHASSAEQRDQAAKLLRARGGDVTSTL